MAQRIRRETTNLEIAGSNPVGDKTIVLNVRVCVCVYSMVLWCNWLSLWTLNPAIRVQIPVEPFVSIYLTPIQIQTRYSSVGRAGDCNVLNRNP